MSKGNLFMGFGRGKVGSVVLARSNGQQVARAYNDAPKNPRSEGQMMQRSIFASAVKFFSQGRQAFYQFAFENKSAKQSDYNAFVAANAKRGMHVSKAAFDESTYPVLVPWMMSKGSLPELDLVYDNEGNKYKLNLPGLSAGATWGAVSQLLKDMYGLIGGDIVTIVTINAQGSNAGNTPAVEPEKRDQIKWDIKQALLDVGSDSAVADIFGTGAAAIEGGITFMGVASADTACGACVTISRMTDAGLKVNDSYVVMNGVAATIYENCKAQDYIDEVLASWKASGKAILEGSLVTPGRTFNAYSDALFGAKFKFENFMRAQTALYRSDGTQIIGVNGRYFIGDTELSFSTPTFVPEYNTYFKLVMDDVTLNLWHYDTESSPSGSAYTGEVSLTKVIISGKTYEVKPDLGLVFRGFKGAGTTVGESLRIAETSVGKDLETPAYPSGNFHVTVIADGLPLLEASKLTGSSEIETIDFDLTEYGNVLYFKTKESVPATGSIFYDGVKIFGIKYVQ